MTNRINPALLNGWTRESVERCRECIPTNDGIVIVCGWHENLTAAAQVVANLVDRQDKDR